MSPYRSGEKGVKGSWLGGLVDLLNFTYLGAMNPGQAPTYWYLHTNTVSHKLS